MEPCLGGHRIHFTHSDAEVRGPINLGSGVHRINSLECQCQHTRSSSNRFKMNCIAHVDGLVSWNDLIDRFFQCVEVGWLSYHLPASCKYFGIDRPVLIGCIAVIIGNYRNLSTKCSSNLDNLL